MSLFDSPRERFLRPLSGKYRAIAAAALVRLYEDFFGPTSESMTLTSESLRGYLARACDEAPVYTTEDSESGVSLIRPCNETERDEALRTLQRLFVEDGWFERYFADLKPALRFTRAGKLMAGALAEIIHPRRRTRLRNMRSVRNALRQFYERSDPDDLADALHYAAAMSDELTDDIHTLQEQGRELLRKQDAAFDHLAELNRRMDGDYAPRLLADNVDTYASDIMDALEKLRSLPEGRLSDMNQQLHRELPWLVDEAGDHGRVLDYALDRVHTIILYGCRPKQTAMVREIQSVTRLMAQIVGHQHFVRAVSRSSALSRLIARLKDEESDPVRLRLLTRFGQAISQVGVRLVDPSSIKMPGKRVVRSADGQGAKAVISWEAQLQHAIDQALDNAIAMDARGNGERLAARLKEHQFVYFSHLDMQSPEDILHAVFALAHVNEVLAVKAEPLRYQPFANDFIQTHDVLMQPADRRPLKDQNAPD